MIIKEVRRLQEKVTEDWSFENPAKDTKEFAKELVDAMWSNSGMGISANQLGYKYRVFAMRGDTKENSQICFNPEIKTFSDNMNTMEEGCLSLPDVYAKVVRPAEVAISFYNQFGREEGQLATGLTARVFQHELDHLDGILFIDRIGELSRLRAFEKAKKIGKARSRGKDWYVQKNSKFAL